jgi:hypothetical protein
MNHLEIVLALSSLLFQIFLCWLVFVRRAQRMVPFFSAYVFVLFASSVFVLLTEWRFGFDSRRSYYVFWATSYVCAAAWCLGIAELCRYELRNFRGIWALVRFVLLFLSVLLIVHAVVDARKQPDVVAIFGVTFLRDVSLASIAILAALLTMRNYYGISLAPVQRLVATGMCVTCAADAIGYTVFRNTLVGYLYSWFLAGSKTNWLALESEVRRVNDIWSTVHLLAFMAAMGIWCHALWKPLPERTDQPVLLPAGIYRQLSPAINLRLTDLNERLTELLKP